MKKKNGLVRRVRVMFSKMHLTDKCLLLFMMLLLLQSAYRLFANDGTSSDIDIIVRTSSAAIFGYFLSANFAQRSASVRRHVSVRADRQIEVTDGGSSAPQSRIGFVPPDDGRAEEPEAASGAALGAAEPMRRRGVCEEDCLQIITATSIGLFCLFVLILVRDFSGGDGAMSASATATVAQLRDFVSGSVGFLIGSPTAGDRTTDI